MADINFSDYYYPKIGFDEIVHQKTNTKGQKQSMWWLGGYYTGTPSAASECMITGGRYMANVDDAFCFCIRKYNETYRVNQYTTVYMLGDGSARNAQIPITIRDGNGKVLVLYDGSKINENPYATHTITATTGQRLSELLAHYNASNELMEYGRNKYCWSFITTTTNTLYDNTIINYSINSTPVYDGDDSDKLDKIKDYIDDGVMIDNDIDYSVDWTVYFTDGFLPMIKIVWRSDALEQAFRNGLLDANNTYINLYTNSHIDGEKTIIRTLRYSDSYMTSSFMEIVAIYDPIAHALFSLPYPTDLPLFQKMFFWLELNTINGLYSNVKISMTYGQEYDYELLPTSNLDNSTCTIMIGTGNNDTGYVPPVTNNTVGNETDSTDGYSALNMLNTSYKITEDGLRQISSVLWGEDFFSKILSINNSPIENIVSCKIIPYNVTGNAERISIGNVYTDVIGYRITKDIKIIIGELVVSEYYNSFLDYAPYTKLNIFLPYIGFKELDVNMFMGHTLKCEYVIDVVTSACKALLFVDNIYVQSFDGQCGIDIPITASNRGQVEAAYVSGALGSIGELATGDVIGATSGLINSAMTPYHYNTQGCCNPSCGSYETKLCYLIIDRPTIQYPTTYGHDIGYPCSLSSSLSRLKGYTVCAGNIDVTGIPATESEKQQIIDLLTSGVYL